MSRPRPTCPSCGLPGVRTSRVRVVFAEFHLSRGGRTIAAHRDNTTRIYRCPTGHRWTVTSRKDRATH